MTVNCILRRLETSLALLKVVLYCTAITQLTVTKKPTKDHYGLRRHRTRLLR